MHVKRQLLIFERPCIQWKNELNNCTSIFTQFYLFIKIYFRKTNEHRQIANISPTTNNNTDHRVSQIFPN